MLIPIYVSRQLYSIMRRVSARKACICSSAPLKPLSIPTNCLKVSLDFKFGMSRDHKGRTGPVVFADRLSKMVYFASCSTNIAGKEAALFLLGQVYRLHGMPEAIGSNWDPCFTSGFWCHVLS